LDQFPAIPQGYYRKLGVVLKSRRSGEQGKNLLVLLKELGPVWVTAPGAASAKSRLSGTTEPLVWGYFTLYRSTKRTYVKEIEAQEDFWSLRREGSKLASALRICAMIVRHALPDHPQDDLFPLFYWSLKALEGGTPADAVEFRFLFRWCAAQGLSPELDRCASCGNPARHGLLTTEGLTCGNCLANVHRQGGLALEEMELNRLKKAVMLSGKEFRAEPFEDGKDVLFGKASALLLKLLEGSV